MGKMGNITWFIVMSVGKRIIWRLLRGESVRGVNITETRRKKMAYRFKYWNDLNDEEKENRVKNRKKQDSRKKLVDIMREKRKNSVVDKLIGNQK